MMKQKLVYRWPVGMTGLCLAALTGALHAEPVNLLPNGSFEFWSRFAAETVPEAIKHGRYDGADPLVPTRWSLTPRGSLLKQSSDAHGGARALTVQGSAFLRLQFLEVAPGASYRFGVWGKGKGRVIVRLNGAAPEGDQRLGEAVAGLTNTWQQVGASVVIPGHIRFVKLELETQEMDGVLDDAHIAAELEEPYDADAVLRDKPLADAHTLLLADFEEDDPAIKLDGKCRYVEGGRFGRCLRVEKPDLTMIPLKLDALPAEGTIEFWLSPDELGQLVRLAPGQNHPIYYFLTVDNANGPLAQFAADTSCTLRWSWSTGPKTGNSLAGPQEVSIARMRKGQWTHVAAAWDAGAMRFYVDGVLYAWTMKPPVSLATLPSNLTVGSMYGHLAWNGAIDEIRVSSINRFAAPLPKGATPRPLPPAVKPVAAPAPDEPAAAKSARDKNAIEQERKRLLGTMPPTRPGAFEETPNADGDYVYEAVRARPLVEGARFDVRESTPATNLTTVTVGKPYFHMIGTPVNGGACWKLGRIKPGTYYVGLIFGSQGHANRNVYLYLNGRVIQTTGLSEPVQLAPGAWFAELRDLAGTELKPGDEIAVATTAWPSGILRLLLHSRPPEVTAFRQGLHVGEDWWRGIDTALRVNAEVDFISRHTGQPFPSSDSHWLQEQLARSPGDFLRNDAGRAMAHCRLANPLPVPVTVEYECTVKGYYGQVAGRDAGRITLQPRQRIRRDVLFDTTDDDPGYSMKATLTLAGDEVGLRRGLGWPEMDTISLLPGLRQSVPWPGAVASSQGRRVVMTEPLKTPRWTRSLNGEWQMAFFHTLTLPAEPPADSRWEARQVPTHEISLAQQPRRQYGAFFRRSFVLPEADGPQSCRLVIDDAAGQRTAWLNGTRVGVMRGSVAPLVTDITEALKPGTNELLIAVQDILSVMNPDYVNPAAPTPSVLYLDAPAVWNSLNLVWLRGVSLEGAPAVAADEVLIATSVRQHALAADFGVVNHTDQPVTARVNVTVQDARRDVFELGVRTLTLAAGGREAVRMEAPWKEPRLWSPQDPHLYVLAIAVTDAATGKTLDLCRQRFGFRESWIQDADIYLNGSKIKPKSLTTPMPYGADLDYTMGRNAGIPDYMDEFGYMASHFLGGVANSASKHNVDRDVYWETARANVLAGARRMQNHPCVIAWDLSNEWYCFLSYSGADMLRGARRLRSLTEAVQKQDPTRWTFYNGDEDLSGLHEAFSGHYLTAYGSPFHDDYRMNGVASYLPDGYFFRPLDKPFERGQPVVVNPNRRTTVEWGRKLLMNTEHLWKVGGMMPPGPTRVMGEECVLSPAVDHLSGPAAWYYKQNLDGHRDLESSVIAFYGGVCPSRRGYLLQQFIMPDTVHHGYGGRAIRRDYSIHNDRYAPAALTLAWSLLDGRGGRAAKGKASYRLESAGVARGTLTLRLPRVAARTLYTLDLRLEGAEGAAYAEQRDIEVWPDAPIPVAVPAGDEPRAVALFDPPGRTAAALAAAGFPARTLTNLADFAALSGSPSHAGAPPASLIIGEGALNTENNAAMAGLASFVAGGGRVIVLAQNVTPGGLPVRTSLEPRHWMSQLFVQTPDHPVLAGVTSWDLHFWAPARVSARGAYVKPAGGPVTTLVNSGGITGMEWMQMFECYRGQGLYLVCQLPLIAAAQEEPMAAELLARVLAYAAGGPAYARPVKPLRVFTAPGSPVDKKLGALGVQVVPEPVLRPLEADAVGLIDASHPEAAAAAAAWKPGLLAGATVVVAGAGPEDVAWLSELAAARVTVSAQPYAIFDGRGYRDGFSRYTAGLTHLDHYFKTFDGEERSGNQAEDPKFVVEPLVDYSVLVAGGRERVFPGALVERQVGDGRLLIDQRRWFTSHATLRKAAERQCVALALGLDVAVAPVEPERQLPDGVVHRPLALGAFANRSLTDVTPDDGKDGWPDQGATCDARSFPTGRQMFQGVPFDIGTGRNAVVLRNVARPGAPDFPTEVTIPVGLPIEGFYALHSSAYTPVNEKVALYQVQYADGSAQEIPVVSGVNIHDWNHADPGFAREKGTRSNIAWTGSNEIFSRISVFRMLWVNPRPETPVAAIRFANPSGQGTVMLAGLTLALSREAAAAPPGAAAEAREMLARATALSGESKFDEACECLEAALKKDPSLAAGYQALADLMERKGDEAAALDVYQRWAAAGANTPLPYNRIGEIMEKRKDYRAALEAYDRSIAVEWNQPPTIQARSRMQKLVLSEE